MKDHIDYLSNLFKYSHLPMPDAVAMADRALAKEMGIDLDTKETDVKPRSDS